MQKAPTFEAAAKLIFTENAKHIHENVSLFLKKDDEMALMQIRIATRRIRVALRIFRDFIHPLTRQTFKEEFRAYGNQMGRARDLDVLLNGLLSEQCPPNVNAEDYQDLRLRIAKIRNREFRKMRKKLKSKQFRNLIKKYDAWCSNPLSLGKKNAYPDLHGFVLDTLDEGRAELMLKGRDLDDYSVEDLHELRKYVKRARYYVRFFASLLKPETVRQAYDLLVPMQDSLGHVNDVSVGTKLLGRICSDVSSKKMKRYLHMNALLLEYLGKQADAEMLVYEKCWADYRTFSISKDDFI